MAANPVRAAILRDLGFDGQNAGRALLAAGCFAFLGAAGNADASKVYVSALGSNIVSVVDTTTNAVTGSISIPSPLQMAVSADATRIYLTHAENLAMIDTGSNTVIWSIPVGLGPWGVALNPSGTRAYVGAQGSHDVAVVDTASATVIARIPIPTNYASEVALSPDGSRLYVTDQANLVYVIDTASNAIIAVVTVGDFVHELAVNSAGTSVYAANFNSDSISVIDATTNTVSATIPSIGSGYGPATLALDRSGALLYTAAYGSGELYVIRTVDNAVITTAPSGGSSPYRLALDPDGSSIYVTHYDEGTVSILSKQTNAVVAVIPVGSQPVGVTVVPSPYSFTGFYPPVDNPPTINSVKAGSAIPVKFSLGGDRGLNIVAAGFPKSQAVSCSGSVYSAIEETITTAGGSSLTYDAATTQYKYVWKTEKDWANTCRELNFQLNDGSTHKATFIFRR